jgi:hypothetical protein
MNNKFISWSILINPIKEINKSPQDRPKVSTNVASNPELNVPVARAVGMTFDKAEPIIPSKDWIETYVMKYPATYWPGPTEWI